MRRAVLTLAVLLAACTRPDGGPAPVRRLVVAYPTGPSTLDPHAPTHEEFSLSILANVYEGLVEVQPDLTLRSGLAESWHSPDDLTWVFVLREGVRFHDGHLLTSADVVRSFELARKDPWMAGEMEPVTSVNARGEREVEFHTRVRFGALPSRLTYFFVTGPPRADGVAAAGTGAYRVRSWSSGGTTVLDAFDGYRGGAPAIREVEFRVIPDAHERARQVREHEVGLTVDVLPEDRAALAAAPGVRVVARAGLRVLFLGLDTVRPPFRDPRVREAVAVGLDKDALVKGPLDGLAERIEQLPRPGEVGFDPELPPRAHDAERARRLLAEAGVRTLDVTLDYPRAKYLAVDAVVREIVRQLAAIGIRVQPRPAESGAFVERVEARQSTLFLLGWLNETGSVHETYESLLATAGHGSGATNGTGWSRPAFDALLDDVGHESSNNRRGELLRQATRMVDAELPIIPLYCQRDVYAFSDQLDFEPPLFRRILISRLRFRS